MSVGSSLAALLLVVCLSLTFVVNAVSAQPIQVSKVPYVFNASIAVDPTNPERIAVVTNQSSRYECVEFPGCELDTLAYTSENGGADWQEQKPSSADFLLPFFDNRGNLYTATNAITTIEGLGNHETILPVISKADPDLQIPINDDGTTVVGSVLNSNVVVESETGTFYMSYLEWFNPEGDFWVSQPELRKSEDEGKTWSEPLGVLKESIWESDSAYPLQPQILLGGDGHIAVVWAQIDDMLVKEGSIGTIVTVTNTIPYSIWIISSKDGGQTFTKPREINIMGDVFSWGSISTAYANGVYYGNGLA